MKKAILLSLAILFALGMVFVFGVRPIKAADYSQTITLEPGWNAISTPRLLESHQFSVAETSGNFDIYTLNPGSTSGWSTLAGLNQTEFTPLYGYFINNKTGQNQTLTFNYKQDVDPASRLFTRPLVTGWNVIGVANPSYAAKQFDPNIDRNNVSRIISSISACTSSILDFTDGQPILSSTKAGETWKEKVVADSDQLNDLRETKAYGVYITSNNCSLSGSQDNSPVKLISEVGSVDVVKATDSPSGTVMTNGHDVVLGKWTVNAHGEPAKVENLTLKANMPVNARTATALRNGRIMINGAQYGSTQNFVIAGTTYTFNYTFPTDTATTIELRADLYASAGGSTGALADNDTILASMVQGSSNGQGTVSLSNVNIPTTDTDASTIVVQAGTISVAANSNYAAQTTTVPQTNYKIASFNLAGSSVEDVNIDTVSVDFTRSAETFPLNSFTNITLKYGGTTESQIKASLSDAAATATAVWSVSHVLAKNAIVPIEIYANINATPTAGNIHTDMTVSGMTTTSNVAATSTSAGQTITVGIGTMRTSVDGSSPSAKLAGDNSTVTTAAFKFAPQYDSYTITELTVGVSNASSVQNVILKDGSTVLGTKPGATSVTFYGLSVPVNANSSKVLTVDLQLGTVGAGSGASGSAITTSLTAYKANTAAGQKTQDDDSGTFPVAGNAMYVFAAVPTITPVTLPSSVLTVGTAQTVAKFTISSNGTGTVSWKKLILNANVASAHVEVANPTLWDADSGTQVSTSTDTVAAVTGGAITFVTTNEQEISGAKTYLVKMDISAVAGQTIVAGDYISTSIAGGTVHIAPTGYSTVAGTASNFVWSDETSIGHSLTTADWNNDYLVKYLPTDSQTLTK